MENQFHHLKFPGENSTYREARNKLLHKELELRDKIEKIAAERRALPLGGEIPEDYEFLEWDPSTLQSDKIKLSQLFGKKNTLIIYSYMFSDQMKSPCPMCTSIIDSMDGSAVHVNQQASLVVIAKTAAERLYQYSHSRGWKNLRLLSSSNNSYNSDYFAEDPNGSQLPACNVFINKEGKIYHFYSTELLYVKSDMDARHVDLMWPLWNFLDLTPEGRGKNWYPSLTYEN